MTSVLCFAVVTEEREPHEPYGSGAVVNTEIVSVHRHHASAAKALEEQREYLSKYLSSRFRAYIISERLSRQDAEKVPA